MVSATKEISTGNFSNKVSIKSKDEVNDLGNAINSMSTKIQTLMESQVEAARQEKELETAKAVQETLLPKSKMSSQILKVDSAYFSASECGGDWWGHLPTDSEVEFICIADATGHGAAAAIVTAMAYSSCVTISQVYTSISALKDAPHMMLERINRVLWGAGHGLTTMTFFAGFIHRRTGLLTFANAGHNPPLLIPRSTSDDRLKNNKFYTTLQSSGAPLGMLSDSTYKPKTMQLIPGDKLFLYTDGLIECRNTGGQMWGKRSMLKTLENIVNSKAENISDSIVKEAFEFFGEQPIEDDVTVVVAETPLKWEKS